MSSVCLTASQLIDFIITTHPAYSELKTVAEKSDKSIHTVLAETLETLKTEAGVNSLTLLTKDLHFYPDLHGKVYRRPRGHLNNLISGNRSPLSDSKMRGSIVGLSLDSSLSDLALKFNVTLEAIALQTRHIIDEMTAHGHDIQSIYISGGQAKNAPLVQLLADVCRIPIVLPNNHSAAVVLGAAMLGKFAAEVTNDVKSTSGDGRSDGLPTFASQADVDRESERFGERLWHIMVSPSRLYY